MFNENKTEIEPRPDVTMKVSPDSGKTFAEKKSGAFSDSGKTGVEKKSAKAASIDDPDKTSFLDKTQAVRVPEEFSPIAFTDLSRGWKGWKVVRRFPAQGGEADVFLVQKDKKECIFKLYRWGIQPKIEVLDRIIRLSKENAEYFVQVYERGYDGESKRFYEIEEYFPQGSLRDLLHRRKLSEDEIARVYERLARALFALHENGILHLDLKPDNVLIRSESPIELVLTDFGIASILDEEFSKKMTDIKGTSLYQSPESLSGIVGPKSDFWSLGIFLLELLQGKHPFDGLQRQVIYYRLTTSGIPIPSNLPSRWVNVLKGLLTRNPDIRWGTAEVRQWLDGVEVKTFFDDENRLAGIDEFVDSGSAKFKRYELPFSFLGKSFFSFEDLLRIFASSPGCWSQAKVALARGQITKWLEDNNETERSGKLNELIDSESDPDRMLFKALYTFYPDLPAVWCGKLLNKKTVLEIMARACDGGVFGEEEKLLEGLFSGDIFKDYSGITGKKVEDLEEMLKLAKVILGTELKNFSLPERSRILLFSMQKSFEPDKALDSLQSAMNGDREFVMILQAAGTKGFSDFARKAGIWKREDDAAWKMAGELYARSSYVATPALEIMVRMSTVIASSIGKDRSLRDMLFALCIRSRMDRDMFERWNNLREKHLWLNNVAAISYEIPEKSDPANFIDNIIQSKYLNERWSKLSDNLLPPFFDSLKKGEQITSPQLKVVKEAIPQPKVFIPKGGNLKFWSDLESYLDELPSTRITVNSYSDLIALKKEYAKTIGLYHQVKIGLLGGLLCWILLLSYGSAGNYLTVDLLVALSFLSFCISVFWPVIRKLRGFKEWRGKVPFEAVFPDPVLVRQKSPKPFNYFNRAGFFFLIMRLSIFHPDVYAVIKFFAYRIWGHP